MSGTRALREDGDSAVCFPGIPPVIVSTPRQLILLIQLGLCCSIMSGTVGTRKFPKLPKNLQSKSGIYLFRDLIDWGDPRFACDLFYWVIYVFGFYLFGVECMPTHKSHVCLGEVCQYCQYCLGFWHLSHGWRPVFFTRRPRGLMDLKCYTSIGVLWFMSQNAFLKRV